MAYVYSAARSVHRLSQQPRPLAARSLQRPTKTRRIHADDIGRNHGASGLG